MVFSQELGDEYVILRVLLDIQYFVKLTTILNTHTISFFLCVVDASSDGFLLYQWISTAAFNSHILH